MAKKYAEPRKDSTHKNYMARRKREKKRVQRRLGERCVWIGGILYTVRLEAQVYAPTIPKPGRSAGGIEVARPEGYVRPEPTYRYRPGITTTTGRFRWNDDMEPGCLGRR